MLGPNGNRGSIVGITPDHKIVLVHRHEPGQVEAMILRILY